MNEPRTCAWCGLPLPVTGRGRPQTYCGVCRAGRHRLKEKPPTVCVECSAVFVQANHTGPAPLRCDACRLTRKAQTDAAKSRRWRDADDPRQKEASRRSNLKRQASPDYPEFLAKRRDYMLEKTYGLTREALNQMIADQNDLCAICGNPHVGVGTRLHVDHNHTTGKVRALLCGKCNTLIGLAGDSPERLDLAAAYLRRHAM